MYISQAREQKLDYGTGVSWGERECRRGVKTSLQKKKNKPGCERHRVVAKSGWGFDRETLNILTGEGKARTGAKTSQMYEETQEAAFTVGNGVSPQSGDGRGRCLRCELRNTPLCPIAREGQGDTAQPSVSRPVGVRDIRSRRRWTEHVQTSLHVSTS